VNLTQNLNNSFEFAKRLLSDGGRLIILIVLDIIPIVNWIVVGYAARVLRESPGTETPPKLERYGEMFVDGAKVFSASVIYMLIPIILIATGGVSLFASMLPIESRMAVPAVMVGGGGAILLSVGVLLGILMLLLLAVGMAHMLKTGKFGKAFAFGEISGIIGRVGWARYLGWIVVVVFISVIIAGVAGLIPYVGWVISAVISPLLSVFVFRSLGLLYNEGAPKELQVQPSVVAGLVCPSCGTPLQSQHKFCPSCGTPAPAPPPPPSEVARFCTNCGAKLASSAKFCAECGAKQE
jgi:hypothetical protein